MKQQNNCSKCGYAITPENLFCPYCGASVKVEKSDAPPAEGKTKKPGITRVKRSAFWASVFFFIIPYLLCVELVKDGYNPNSTRGFYLKIFGYVQMFTYGYFIKTSIRRLHDIGRSGWFIFPSALLTIAASVLYVVCLFCKSDNPVVGYTGIVGWAAIIVNLGMVAWLGFTKGVRGPNKYGPDPLDKYGLGEHEPVTAPSAPLCRERAEEGAADAQYDLGALYMYGEGLEKDAEEGVKWYRKAAEQGLADAQYDLGMCYMQGEGVEKNSQEAEKWFRKAAGQGHQLAIEALRALGSGD